MSRLDGAKHSTIYIIVRKSGWLLARVADLLLCTTSSLQRSERLPIWSWKMLIYFWRPYRQLSSVSELAHVDNCPLSTICPIEICWEYLTLRSTESAREYNKVIWPSSGVGDFKLWQVATISYFSLVLYFPRRLKLVPQSIVCFIIVKKYRLLKHLNVGVICGSEAKEAKSGIWECHLI